MRRSPVQLAQDLIRINSVNPPGNESACAAALAPLLERAGFHVTRHEFAAGRTSLVARIGGHRDKMPLCITGHIDTVPLGSAPWSRDPHAGETDSGRLYGRGSSDMKSGVAAFTVAALDLAEKLGESAGLVLVITAGEETGCQGVLALARTAGALDRFGAIVVGEPTSNRPVIGHKGALWLRCLARGVTAHGSMPEQGDNAIYKAAEAICRLSRLKLPGSVTGRGNATLNVGTVNAGLNINSVPDLASFEVDIRTPAGLDNETVRAQVASALGEQIAIETMLDLNGVHTDVEHEWVRKVCDVVSRVTREPVSPSVVTYFTDASVLTPACGGPPTLVLGPGEPEQAHKTDEYCRLSKIEDATEIYREIILEWCER